MMNIQTEKKKVESTLLDFPLYIKYKSERYNNFRSYVLVGIKYSIDIASQKDIVEEDQTLVSKEIEIIGLYDPSENGLSINMWSNSDGEKIISLLESLDKINLSKDASEILNILLLTNSYYPNRNISKEEFIKIKSKWLIKNSDLKIIEDYLINRENLKQVFVLIDCKVGIKDSDIDILDFISENNKQFSIILTKIDKCSIKFVDEEVSSLLSLLKNYSPNFTNIFSSSSSKNMGIVDIQKEIFNLAKLS